MLNVLLLFPWSWSLECITVVSVLVAQDFTSHFFFVSLNSNRWQGNTYGAVNYLLGANLSGPDSEIMYIVYSYIWLFRWKKRNMQFGGWYWLMASSTEWKTFSRNGVIVLSVLHHYLHFIQRITRHLQNWQSDFKKDKMKGIPLFLGAMCDWKHVSEESNDLDAAVYTQTCHSNVRTKLIRYGKNRSM